MIKNVKVYALKESVIASGYPMRTETPLNLDYEKAKIKDIKRGAKLGGVDSGTGHDNFAKGILVQFDWTTPVLMQPQILRYHHIDIVSSQSSMHKITKMDIKNSVGSMIHKDVLEIVQDMIDIYEDDLFWKDHEVVTIDNLTLTRSQLWRAIVHNCPQGLLKTARYTTNYLQLKTMYQQRRFHKLVEWKEFCEWCLSLPMFKEFCLKKGDELEAWTELMKKEMLGVK